MAVSDRSGWHTSQRARTHCVFVSRGLSLRSSCVFLFGWEIVRMMYMNLWNAHLDLNSNFVNLPKEINDFNSLRNWFLKRFYGFVTTNCGCSLCVCQSQFEILSYYSFFLVPLLMQMICIGSQIPITIVCLCINHLLISNRCETSHPSTLVDIRYSRERALCFAHHPFQALSAAYNLFICADLGR